MDKRQTADLVRKLRSNGTEAERVLWLKLRNRQLNDIKFRRQQPIGNYVVDFVSFERKLIIEVDGGQHNEYRLSEKDEIRSKWLALHPHPDLLPSREKGWNV